MRRNSIPRGTQSGSARGPLLTNHLHDIDLELELLKRKREMVEQQQHLLGLNFPNQSHQQRPNNQGGYNNNFVQPMQNFNQPRGNQPPSLLSNFNFSNLYDEAPQSFRQRGDFDRQRGTKRQATVPIWESDSAPKRFSGPQRFSQKPPARRNDTPRRNNTPRNPPPPRNNYPKSNSAPARPKPTGQIHGSSRFAEPHNRNKDSMGANPRQKNVTKNKIHKPTNSTPNKLNSYPVEQRKALVKQALKKEEPKDQVLLADEEPDKQTIGRLEMALGHILKDMRQKYGKSKEYEDHFVKIVLTRAVKNVMRERLRSALVGKPVRLYPEVIQFYRVKFPVETDKEILDLASERVKEEKKYAIQNLKIVDEVHPERYFRRNIQRLMKSTLDEMFVRLQEIYVTNGEWKIKPNETEDSVVMTVDENKEVEKEKSTDDSVADNTTDDVGNTSGKVDTQENNVTLDKTGDIVEEKKDDNVEEKKDEIVEEKKDEIVKEKKVEIVEDKKDDIVDEKKDCKDAEGTEDAKAVNEDDIFNDPENNKTIAFYDHIMNMLLKRRLPYLLPRYKESIIRYLDLISEYRQTKAAIILGTEQRAEKLSDSMKQKANQSNSEANNSKTNKHQRNLPQFTLYFVKIFARPSLPKRPVMQEFLDKFNPKSIKRHKNVHNLLFVGFSNEEDMNNILKEDNCTIGKLTLSIKASDKNKEEANKETAKPVEAIEKPASENTADASISSDIDNQNNTNQNTEDVAEATNNGDKATIEEKVDDNDNAEEALLNDENLNTDAEIGEDGNADEEVKEDDNEEANFSNQNTDQVANIEKEKGDNVGELKNEALDAVKETGKSTPTRASTRLATSTPNTIKTRRAADLLKTKQ